MFLCVVGFILCAMGCYVERVRNEQGYPDVLARQLQKPFYT